MNTVTKTGLIVGILSSLYLALLSSNGNFGGSALKYGKYIIIMIALMIFYKQMVSKWSYNDFMGNFIGSAFRIALISGITVAVINSFLYLIDPTLSTQKYNLLADSLSQLLLIDVILIVEMVVLGMLSSFIIFPLFKNIPNESESHKDSTIDSDYSYEK